MSTSRLALACLLLATAVPTARAGTVEKFGATHIYGSVDSQGIPLFTDIPPAEDRPTTNNETPARPSKARAKPLPGNDAGVVASPRSDAAPHFGAPHPDQFAEATPPGMRDGGIPPDDH